ncbi:MAG: alpha/beta hydrolase, partial [Myxococcota bacterium]|nr:alpha/beta hydrolase [Myxococcota bacterium]
MRSLALVAFLSQFSLQGVTRCAPAPTNPTPDTPTVEEPVGEDAVETRSLARDVDYAAAGDFSFTTTDELIVELPTGRQVKVSLFEPNATGPLPLVVLSPGFQLNRDFYRSYAEHLASWGFIVATQSYSGRVSGLFNSNHASIAEDTLALVEALQTDTYLNLNINPEAVGLIGHSLGGKISILSAVLDSSIAAVVGLDPVDANTPSV